MLGINNWFSGLLILLAIGSSDVFAQQNENTHGGSEVVRGTFSGAKPTEYPSWFKESFLEFEDDIAEAAQKGKRVMLLFHQDGCPYCNLLVERNLSQKNIVELMQKKFDVIEINIWGDRDVITIDGESFTEKQLASALKVQFTPTLLFYDEQGQGILKLNGYLPPTEFLAALNYVSGQYESKLSYRDYVRSQIGSQGSAKALISEPFFQNPPYQLERSNEEPNRPLAVFFEQKQCPNCETLHSKVLIDPETRKLIADYDAVQLDMWSNDEVITLSGESATAREWASSLGVSYAPTIILFDRNGREVIRSEAWFKIFHTQSLFDYVNSEAFRTEPNFQRYISARADDLIEQGIDVDIWR